MAFGHVGRTTNGTFGTSMSVNVPAGTGLGDLMFFVINIQSNSVTVTTPPSGFTLLYARPNNVQTTYIYYKIASGSEPANYSVTISGSSIFMGLIDTWEVDAYEEPISEHAQVYTTNVTRISSTAVSTLGSNGAFLHYLAVRDTGGTSAWDTPSGYSKAAADHSYSSGRILVYHKVETDPVSSGSVTFIETLEDFNYDAVTLTSMAIDVQAPVSSSGGFGSLYPLLLGK